MLSTVLREEAEEAVHSLKAEKYQGVDKIPSELLNNGSEATATVSTAICQKIVETKEWPKEWTQSLVIPLPKKSNFKHCQNFCSFSVISFPIKIMPRVIFNRLKSKAEEIFNS